MQLHDLRDDRLSPPDRAGEAISPDRGKRETTTYRFGTGAARHIFCGQCGIKSFYKPRSHPDGISINLRCLDEGHGLDVRIVPFDGRHAHPGAIG